MPAGTCLPIKLVAPPLLDACPAGVSMGICCQTDFLPLKGQPRAGSLARHAMIFLRSMLALPRRLGLAGHDHDMHRSGRRWWKPALSTAPTQPGPQFSKHVRRPPEKGGNLAVINPQLLFYRIHISFKQLFKCYRMADMAFEVHVEVVLKRLDGACP